MYSTVKYDEYEQLSVYLRQYLGMSASGAFEDALGPEIWSDMTSAVSREFQKERSATILASAFGLALVALVSAALTGIVVHSAIYISLLLPVAYWKYRRQKPIRPYNFDDVLGATGQQRKLAKRLLDFFGLVETGQVKLSYKQFDVKDPGYVPLVAKTFHSKGALLKLLGTEGELILKERGKWFEVQKDIRIDLATAPKFRFEWLIRGIFRQEFTMIELSIDDLNILNNGMKALRLWDDKVETNIEVLTRYHEFFPTFKNQTKTIEHLVSLAIPSAASLMTVHKIVTSTGNDPFKSRIEEAYNAVTN